MPPRDRRPEPPGRIRRRRRLPWVLWGALFVAGEGLAVATGEWAAMLLWPVAYAAFSIGCALTRLVWFMTEDWWLLRRRGIPALATYDRTDHGYDSDGDPTYTKVYVFTDDSG